MSSSSCVPRVTSTVRRFSKLIMFFFQSYRPHRDLHSFPTRRSSDLRSSGRRRGSCWRRSSPTWRASSPTPRSEEHTSELQSHHDLVCRLLLEKKKFSEQLAVTHLHAASETSACAAFASQPFCRHVDF